MGLILTSGSFLRTRTSGVYNICATEPGQQTAPFSHVPQKAARLADSFAIICSRILRARTKRCCLLFTDIIVDGVPQRLESRTRGLRKEGAT